MSYRNIHGTVIRRLAAAWLVLSALIGGVVLYLETGRIDRLVVDLALKESRIFSAADLVDPQGARLERLHRKADELIRAHFVIVELYTSDFQLMVRTLRPDADVVERQIDQSVHSFPDTADLFYRKLIVRGHLYLQVLVPMTDQGRRTGYFEGVYRVDEATQQDILAHVASSLALVIVSVLAATVTLYPIIIHLNRDLIQFSIAQLRGNIELLNVLGGAIAKRDSDTNAHNYRVTLYAVHLAEALGLDSDQIRSLIAGAFLHDVGKIGIRDSILLKPGRLTAEEIECMRQHVVIGLDIIEKSNWLKPARSVVEYHHERFDGSGYMKGLKGEEIPMAARIFAVADAFDALVSRRPYKEAYSLERAMSLMESEVGTHFDPGVFEAFRRIAPALHRETGGADENRLIAMLDGLILEHFFMKLSLKQGRTPVM